MKPLHAALLLLILVSAALLRRQSGEPLVLTSAEAQGLPSLRLIDDPDTCVHLRRIAATLGQERAPERDAWLAQPDGAPYPWLPLYDTLVARCAGVAERGRSADPDVREAWLERFALGFGPILGVLAVLATWLALRALFPEGQGGERDDERGGEAALWGAAFVALDPRALHESSAGRLDPHALLTLFAALALYALLRLFRARGLRETLFAALPAGALLGLGCATSPAGVLAFALALGAAYVHAWRAAPDQRRDAWRAGLLLCLVAAFASQLPLPADPETHVPAGFVGRLQQVGVALMLLGGVPFLAGFVLAGERDRRAFRIAALLVAGLVVVWAFPRAVRLGGAVWTQGLEVLEARGALLASRPSWSRLGSSLDLMFVAASLLVLVVLYQRSERARRTLVFAVAGGVVLPPLMERVLSVPWHGGASLMLALLLALLFAGPRLSVTQMRVLAGGLLATAGLGSFLQLRADDHREERLGLVRELRRLRGELSDPAGAGAAGAMNPGAEARGALWTTPWLSALAVYHARRPVSFAAQAAIEDPAGLRRQAALAREEDAPALLYGLRSAGARHVLVGQRAWSESFDLERHDAGRGWRAGARPRVWKLDPDAAAPAELRCVFRGASFDVWELSAGARAPDVPQIRAR